jgi:prevent-host-death family protein
VFGTWRAACRVRTHEFKTHFSRFVQRVREGGEVVVLSSGTPVAKLVPYPGTGSVRKPGLLKGQITIQPGFDDVPEGFEPYAG